jgi:hypothetical protein
MISGTVTGVTDRAMAVVRLVVEDGDGREHEVYVLKKGTRRDEILAPGARLWTQAGKAMIAGTGPVALGFEFQQAYDWEGKAIV